MKRCEAPSPAFTVAIRSAPFSVVTFAQSSARSAWDSVIPRYGVGHAERMQSMVGSLAQSCPSLHLAGTYLDGVSVEECLTRGRRIGRELAASCKPTQEAVA